MAFKRHRGLKYFSTSGVLFATASAKLGELSATVYGFLTADYSNTSTGISPPTETSI